MVKISKSRLLKYLVPICTGSLAAFLLGLMLKPSVELLVTLTEPVPNPTNFGNIQVLTLQNQGKKTAANLTVKVTYPRIIRKTSDYQVKTIDPLVFATRADSYLRFQVKRLPRDDNVLAVFAVGGYEIEPENIEIVHDEGTVKPESIKHVRLTRWRE